ncbi:MAG TPA: S8 family serine peptidase [Steroidobacteraceae bacterium]|nr:S8 family serine peptidase [Steroidobacteraceae bacterium]
MTLRFFAIGALTAVAAVGISSAVAPPRPRLHALVAPGSAHLYVVGTRSAVQRQSPVALKMDSMLADLTRHAALARPDHLLADLRSLSPAARFAQPSPGGPAYVVIDATTHGDPQQLKAALVALGLQHPAVYSNDVGGLLPVGEIEAASARAEVASVRAAMPHARTGAVESQGDFAQRSSVVRTNYSTLLGTGVTVGVLSDSFNCYAVYAAPGSGVPASGNTGYAYNGFTADYATDMSTGDLPANVNVLEEAPCLNYGAPTQLPFGDEGRAMLQIVYDVAPGASLAFYTAEGNGGEADFASGIGKLAAAGAKVIADDVGYYDEPFFQDGLVAQAVDAVEAQGVAYFSAAGNDSNLAYQNTAPSFSTVSSSAPNAGEHLLNFDRTGATNATSLPVTIPALSPGEFVAVVVEWDQPYVTGATGSPGASSSIDLCITGGTGADTITTDNDNNPVSCTGPNAVGSDPDQILIVGNPANATGNSGAQNLNIQVGLAANSAGTIVPGRIVVAVEDDGAGSTINAFATNSATIQGHPGAAGAAAVGAAFYFQTAQCGTTPAVLEQFSSEGGAPILFDTSGTRLATPVVRQKPDFVGPDGGNDTFLGFTLASQYPQFPKNGMLSTSISQCQNDYAPAYPNFFGTSAATPHAAGIAALMLQAAAAQTPAITATPAQIYSSLRASALPMSGSTPNFSSGYGFIQADTALVIPTLTLSAPSIALGSPATLTWSSLSTTASCMASSTPAGPWSGAQAGSGSVVLTPAAAGTVTYTLSCTNSAGTSASNSVSLPVYSGTPPATPTLTLGSSSVEVGTATTLAWSSTNATGCTASGAWSGSLAASGSESVTPAAIGPQAYTLTCSNLGGPSAPVSVTLNGTAQTVVPPAPTLTLGATSTPAFTTITVNWSDPTASSCTAGGTVNAVSSGWTGVLAPTGQSTITPTTLGTFTYTLYCVNSAGQSPTTTATLTVTASKDTGGGGGAFDGLTLIGAAAWVLRRVLAGRDRPRPASG